jgi:Ataxin-3
LIFTVKLNTFSSDNSMSNRSKTYIYHEKQDSHLCGQHCLNNLLQGPYFTAVDLAGIASNLDAMERRLGVEDNLFHSANVDDSGNFSVQVLRVALQNCKGVDLVPWFQKKGEASVDVSRQLGFVINRSNHWFALRRVGGRWWDLNSTIDRPDNLSDTALVSELSALRASGCSVFIAQGGTLASVGNPNELELPRGSTGVWYAEDDLIHSFLVGSSSNSSSSGRTANNTAPSFQAFQGQGNRLGGPKVSLETPANCSSNGLQASMAAADYDEELELAKAISASLCVHTPIGAPAVTTAEDMRAKRLAALSRIGKNPS